MNTHKLSAATAREISIIHKDFKKNPNGRGALATLALRVAHLPEVQRVVCRFDDHKAHPIGEKPYFTLHHDHPAIYLLGWREGEWTDIHDHGACEVGIHVVQGQVVEDLYVTEPIANHRDRKSLLQFSRILKQGESITCPENYVHSVGNIFPQTAATLHVYGPDLHDMRLFDREGGILKFKSTWTNSHDPQH